MTIGGSSSGNPKVCTIACSAEPTTTRCNDASCGPASGDHPLRYFLEPAYLTANFAKAKGYADIFMAGLSGGGWSTTFASAYACIWAPQSNAI